MNRLSLYASLPTALQHLATALYGLHTYAARSGRSYRDQRLALSATEHLDAEQIAELQTAKLRLLIAHATSRTSYYGQVYRSLGITPGDIRRLEDLPRLPILDKSTVFERSMDIRAKGVGPVRTYHTSGTSGTTLAIPIDDASRQRNYAFFARARAWAGVEHGRSATFAGRPVVPGKDSRPRQVWRWNPAMRNRLFSSYHISPDNAKTYSEALCAWAPDDIDAYPSAVASLAALFRDLDLPAPRPQAIITSSETLSEAQRTIITEVFRSPVFDQYGSTEQAAYISQCEAGTYHIHPEYGIVEIVDPDGNAAKPGEPGELLCTSFTNDAFPLIRYRIGDSAVAAAFSCPCGRQFLSIEGIIGRTDDLILTPDGRRIGRLDPIFKGRPTIREAQIAQVAPERVVVRLVPARNYATADAEALLRELAARLGPGVQIRIEQVPAIERTASGKFRAVVNEMRDNLPRGHDLVEPR
jgi:phenylacetate-CoA ligase